MRKFLVLFLFSVAAMAQTLTITSPSTIPTGYLNTPYRYTFTASGGTTPYTWTFANTCSGACNTGLGWSDNPNGYTSSTGILNGTPANAGTSTQGLTVTDATGATATKSITIVISSSPPPVATPTASPTAGTYTSTQSVVLSDATTGAAIHYTTDGSTPTASSTLYSGPISVAATTTIKAIGTKSGSTNSAVATFAYTINSSTSTYNFSCPGTIAGSITIDSSGNATVSLASVTMNSGCSAVKQ
jgi:hypothetical protein